MVDGSRTPRRFEKPKQLNLETRILHDLVPGGVTIGEMDAAFQKYWANSSLGGSQLATNERFFLVGGSNTEEFDFELSLHFNAGTPSDAEPDRITGHTRTLEGELEFVIERRGGEYVRLLKINGDIELVEETAVKAHHLLPECITNGYWVKRGPFRVRKP